MVSSQLSWKLAETSGNGNGNEKERPVEDRENTTKRRK